MMLQIRIAFTLLLISNPHRMALHSAIACGDSLVQKNPAATPTAADDCVTDDVTPEEEVEEEEEDLSDEEDWPLGARIFMGIFVCLIGLTNIVGNTCTVYSFVAQRRTRTVASYYIFNLAITDLVVGAVSVPFYAVYTVMDFYWPFGYAFCKVWSVIDFWICAESSLTIVLISHDRLQMVQKGADYARLETPRKALIKIGLSWVYSFLLYTPAIIGFNYWRGYSTVEPGDCDVEFSTEIWYTLITALLEFLIPFILVVVFSGMLYVNIRRISRRVAPRVATIATGKMATTGTDASGGTSASGGSDGGLNKAKKAAKNLLILVIVFLICWTPYTVATLIIAVCDECVDTDMFEVFNWMLWLNSSVNPLLYAYTNEKYREDFQRLFCRLCRKNRSTTVTHVRVRPQEATKTTNLRVT